jgi:hypothetical protein
MVMPRQPSEYPRNKPVGYPAVPRRQQPRTPFFPQKPPFRIYEETKQKLIPELGDRIDILPIMPPRRRRPVRLPEKPVRPRGIDEGDWRDIRPTPVVPRQIVPVTKEPLTKEEIKDRKRYKKIPKKKRKASKQQQEQKMRAMRRRTYIKKR